MTTTPEFVRVEGMGGWPRIAEALRGKNADQEAIAQYFLQLTDRTLAKNHDYGSSVWKAKSRFVPHITVPDKIQIRIEDKLDRLEVLNTLGPQVNESRIDTLEDIGIYYLLMALWLRRQEQPESER